jgi:hypothetical protein
VPLGQRPWAYRLGLPLAGGQQKAAAQQIEARPAKHLAFEHFEAIAQFIAICRSVKMA